AQRTLSPQWAKISLFRSMRIHRSLAPLQVCPPSSARISLGSVSCGVRFEDHAASRLRANASSQFSLLHLFPPRVFCSLLLPWLAVNLPPLCRISAHDSIGAAAGNEPGEFPGDQ